MTQTQAVLYYMQEHGTITTWEAITELHVTRLSAKIFDLIKAGYPITKRSITVPATFYGKQTTVTEYTLEQE